ncbi:MAG TPA: hypothetical protein DCS60_05650 [Opitutae bacterium]|nr:hypothetical protein [Opitutae bacterium]
MGWKLSIDSNLNDGTKAFFTIPQICCKTGIPMLIRYIWLDRVFWLRHSDAAFPWERLLGGSPGFYGLSSDNIAANRLGIHSIPFLNRLS